MKLEELEKDYQKTIAANQVLEENNLAAQDLEKNKKEENSDEEVNANK